MVERWGALCECSWGGSGDPAGHHDLLTHGRYGRGACTGRDSYGQPCECPGHVPIPDDDEESGDVAQPRRPDRVPLPPHPGRPVRAR